MGVGARVTLLRSLVSSKRLDWLGKLNYKLRHTGPVLCETQMGVTFGKKGNCPRVQGMGRRKAPSKANRRCLPSQGGEREVSSKLPAFFGCLLT